MKKDDIAARMQEILNSLPDPGEASGNQPYNITMFKMNLLIFRATERLNKLTYALIVLTAILAALTIVLIVITQN
ncbi:MAG: hypothetical protein Q7K33_04265 [Candidatus Berkelbacteria bacterium]|nr:hypothetical protein [Candidatus Berkelbacteria bacterium]